MAINQNRYVNIVSGVVGEASASRRELIARWLTTNVLAPYGKVLEFTSLDAVGDWFGASSNEYQVASKYFSFISKIITKANKISFARYSKSALAPYITATKKTSAYTTYADLTTFKCDLNGDEEGSDAIDLSGASSLSEVASTVSAAMTGIVITYDSVRGCFTASATDTGSEITLGNISGDIAEAMGLTASQDPIVSLGSDSAETVDEVARVAEISDNFGSFAFIEPIAQADIVSVATWNAAQNVKYLYVVPVNASNYSQISTAVSGLTGTWLQLNLNGDYSEYEPMVVGACIDYSTPNASTNFMFQPFDSDTPTVFTDKDADKYDAALVNYLGQTMQAGSKISFLQRGNLVGEISDAGVYWNEMWLKDAIITEFLNMFVALPQIPANEDGAAQCKLVIQNIINEALYNRVILVGKGLTNVQKAYIGTVSGDNEAWRDVENNGYWLKVSIKTTTNNNVVEYYASYTLIYAKGDSIRKVEGRDILI